MVKIIKNIAATLFATFTICSTVFAGGGGFTGATEWTQLANNYELVEIFNKNIAQLKAIEQQLSDAQKNTALIQNDYHWSHIRDNLVKLGQVVQQNQAIAYSASNINDTFTKRFPGYQEARKYNTDYQSWSNTAMDSIRGSLLAANLQASQFVDEESTLRELRRLSQTPQGRMQAIQVGNQIAIEQVTQTQKLRQLIMSQIQAQGNYMAAQEQKDANERASVELIFPSKKATDGKNYKGFKGGNL